LKEDAPTETDIRLLDEYRRSFGQASETVVQRIQEKLGLAPTARPAKSTASVVDKLKRETIRLTQIQDIAGCRIVVANVKEQDDAVASLRKIFPGATVIDRRKRPSFGYRAVHLIPKIDEVPVEIQVRTLLQHRWAEFSEKLADRFGSELKYGGGDSVPQETLGESSKLIASHEAQEREMFDTLYDAEQIGDRIPAEVRERLAELQGMLNARSQQIGAFLSDAVARL
jgi:putative GTP pyrophosphokinase